MINKMEELFRQSYFGMKRENVNNATVALRFFQGRNHLLTAVTGPEHGSSPEMTLSLKVSIQPRGETHNRRHARLEEKIKELLSVLIYCDKYPQSLLCLTVNVFESDRKSVFLKAVFCNTQLCVFHTFGLRNQCQNNSFRV